MDNKKSHLKFNKTIIERPRHKPKGRGKKPERDNIQYGQSLIEKVTVLQVDFEQSVALEPPEFDPAFIFRIRLEGNISEDELRRSGLTLLSEEPNEVIVLFSEDQLNEFKSRVDQYGQEISEDKKSPTYGWIASATTEMTLWGREDRKGKKLADIDIEPDEEYRLDVELWSYGNQEENESRITQLNEFVENSEGKILDHFMDASIIISRILVTGDNLERLLEVDIVQTIDLPPAPGYTVIHQINTRIDEFPNPVLSPSEESPGICVIDSGVNRGHPVLSPAIGDSRAFPNSLGDGLDQHGHGTMISGIALYGDVSECINTLNFEPQVYLFVAQVTNKENRFDDDRLIITQMNDSINYFFKEYGCRVFNISLGDPDLIYQGGKPSNWAYILDNLARELDIVIVVPTGNINLLSPENNGTEANRIRDSYQSKLLEDNSRILEPSTAANVITVGSLTNSEEIYSSRNYPDDPAYQLISRYQEPSPFTRRGPGVNNSIKPEVCDYGGSFIWEGRPNPRVRKDPGVGIVSTNMNHLERLFGVDVGTSYAAPKIANLAGLILKKYPNLSANLIRALIANSAIVPEAAKGVIDKDDILNICGYGLVDHERALFSSDNRVTLITEDEVPIDKLHLYEIPIPDELKQANGKRRISIALAFDPPVRHTRKDYLGVKMEFRLFRGLTTEQIVSRYSLRPKNYDLDNIENKFKCKYHPSMTKINKGTLQKAVFEVSRNSSFLDYDGDIFHLLVCSKAGWASADEYVNQKYGLTVTLEHLSDSISLYQTIRQRIRSQSRIRARA